MKAALIAALAGALLWVSAALVRVENERYALSLGMCLDESMHRVDPNMHVADYQCLKRVETRTGWWWHLYYALTGG